MTQPEGKKAQDRDPGSYHDQPEARFQNNGSRFDLRFFNTILEFLKFGTVLIMSHIFFQPMVASVIRFSYDCRKSRSYCVGI